MINTYNENSHSTDSHFEDFIIEQKVRYLIRLKMKIQ